MTATTGLSDGFRPVNGSTGSGRRDGGAVVGAVAVGLGVTLGVTAGGAMVWVSSFLPIATAAPTPTSTTAAPTAAIVCTRFQTNPAIGPASASVSGLS
ncbi:MAG TPA: hypothetical protein VM428_09060 [Microlunatus sp.]|nr:hypothetical protein [Microlunatus sp.]